MSLITSHWMTCSFMRLATLQFEMGLHKCIRMGITIFKIFVFGGILLDIRSEITFYGSALRCKTIFLTVYPTINLPN